MNNIESKIDSKENKFYFTVEQLIEVLKILPQDLPVVVSGYENGYENFFHPSVVKLTHKSENPYYDGEFQIADKECKGTFDAVILQRVERND